MTRLANNLRMRWVVCGGFIGIAPAQGATAALASVTHETTCAQVATRFAAHDTFDRLVLSLPPGTQAASHQSGDIVSLQLPGCGHVTQPSHFGRRLLALREVSGQANLQLAPGDRARIWRLSDLLVVDVLGATAAHNPAASRTDGAIQASAPPRPDAAVKSPAPISRLPETEPSVSAGLARPPGPVISAELPPAALASRTASPPPLSGRTPPMTGETEKTAGRASSEVPTQANTSQTPRSVDGAAPDTSSAPSDSAILPLVRDGEIDGPAVLVPCPRGTGAAAYERAGEAHVVFDRGKPLDLSALKDDPVFGDVREQVLTDGLELRLHVPAGSQLRLVRRVEGWALIVPSARLPAPNFEGHVHESTLVLGANGPGRIVVVSDEVTGGRLLVGTQTGQGQRMPAAHAAPEFTILPSWLGLVVAPVSDRLVVRTSRSGFELSQEPPELAVAWSKSDAVSWPDGRVMTRLFDLPDLPPESLHRRLGQALRDAALAPKPARFMPRLAVARTMLAQGMDVEAASVLQAALADDPAHLDEPSVTGLSAIAEWLSAKTGGGQTPRPRFDPARLAGSDEAVLWRVLLQSGVADPASQAAALAPVWPLIFSYPQALRRPMLLAASAVLQAGGQVPAWTALLAASADPALDASRAALLQQQGRTDEALALLDRVAGRPDRLARANAMQQATELRVATHRLDAAAAADALDRQLYEWRGDDRELNLRVRVAALQAQAGAWRAALSTLRGAEQIFPEARSMLRKAEEETVSDLLLEEHAAKLANFDLVSLAEEAANLFSSAEVERRLGPILVEKLLALDLPDRAESILQKLFDRTSDRASKAAYGLGLASLIADRGEAQAAVGVLNASDDDGLASSLVGRRTVLRARLLSALGKTDEALRLLEGQHASEASDIAASLLEKRNDWPGASAVLQTAMQQQDFSKLPEPSQRAVILRLARDESTQGDVAGLHALRQSQQARFASGEGAELFAILTAEPVTSAADLPRSGREIASLRTLPAKLAQPRTF